MRGVNRLLFQQMCLEGLHYTRSASAGNSVDQTLVRIESLLAIQTPHKVSRSLANRSSDAAGINFYRPALGANITVFIFQGDVVCVQSISLNGRSLAGWVCQFSLTQLPGEVQRGIVQSHRGQVGSARSVARHFRCKEPELRIYMTHFAPAT
jgi:hypothetical protein